MRIAIFLIIVAALWTLAKKLRANAVIGMKAQIKPIRKDSKLTPFIKSAGLMTKTVVVRENDVWIEMELSESIIMGDKEYTHLMIKPKSVDDNVNKKKAVVCSIKAVDLYSKQQFFVDFGTVIAVAP